MMHSPISAPVKMAGGMIGDRFSLLWMALAESGTAL
jgi:hypothetical protein